ncbi:hypothetical protein [Celeribacter persicus]|uniref:Uncharacterized protein n=1 Tax=Celeribacter persicus TaxID=1651082 RepID=A0A2T5HMC3_9RHOB|nr:hypothetical protein [Celeribacter persicus]PTQ72731.1 hypothetical protein C8N42_106243 [Celeribacter persicus]
MMNERARATNTGLPDDTHMISFGERVMSLSPKRQRMILNMLDQLEIEQGILPQGALDRLSLFGEWTGTTPPENILEDHGDGPTFSNDLLSYAVENGMSLDWFWMGDERGLVICAHNEARENLS